MLASVRNNEFWKSVRESLNFFRVHLLVFTFTPLFWSGIFYASNGEYKVSYIDSLFNCVSAMCVCGLATVNLSSLTGWQQTILFLQMCMGSPVAVSWVMVYIRKYYFAKKFQHILGVSKAKRAGIVNLDTTVRRPKSWRSRLSTIISRGDTAGSEGKDQEGATSSKRGAIRNLRPDMIRRVDDAPKPVNPSGWITEEQLPLTPPTRRTISKDVTEDRRQRRLSDPGQPSRPSSPTSVPMYRFETMTPSSGRAPSHQLPRTQTVEFAPAPQRRRERPGEPGILQHEAIYQHGENILSPDFRHTRSHHSNVVPSSVHTHPTIQSHHSGEDSRRRGYGGFPMPLTLIYRLCSKLFPKLQRKLTRSVTTPASVSLIPSRGGGTFAPNTKAVSYISFETVVGRNSAFHLLTGDQLKEIGGVEYRALNALLWIVGGYHLGIQLVAFAVIAPYMTLARWRNIFLPPEQQKPVDSTWFSAYQVVSAYTNTGVSLVDQSMVPFQKAYPMTLWLMFLILSGNTCFPIFLRFLIWLVSKLVSRNSCLNETLHFLLDHPRRCFIYLFPSHQTWFLLTIVVVLSLTDFIFFVALDINNPAFETISKGILVFNGLFQALAVRAAGFTSVSLSAIAPAVKVLFMVMMYISVYPIAMSVRSTNVYEEQTLGIFHNDDSEDEESFEPNGPRISVWGRYLRMHARRQLAFDMWWLALALFFVCWIEDPQLRDPENYGWFNIFNITFELVSAYGTVGLSLGIPTENYSLSGKFKTLSKLVVCLVMLRGRHRGLPVAIDRAVMFPAEFGKVEEAQPDIRSIPSNGAPGSQSPVPFRYSETMVSHPGSDIHRRFHRASMRFSDDDGYSVAEKANKDSGDHAAASKA